MKHATRAAELTKHADPGILDTLAAAYAAAGRFPDAIATAEKAIGLAKAARQNAVVEELSKALDRYRRNIPPGR